MNNFETSTYNPEKVEDFKDENRKTKKKYEK